MKMSKVIPLVSIGILILVFIVFVKPETKSKVEGEELKEKIVRVQKVEEKEEKEYLEYMGIIKAQQLIKFSFIQSGTIDEVFVEKGDYVEKGKILASLNIEQQSLAHSASKAQLEGVKSAVVKAAEALGYAKENYNRVKEIYLAGGLSDESMDQAELDLKVKQQDYNSAAEAVNQAQANFKVKEKNVNDALIKTDIEGFIVDVLYEEGETVSSGLPVIVLRNENKVVNVGISQKDITKIKGDTPVVVELNGNKIEGQITSIYQVPNEQTRTYPVEISVDNRDIPIGAICRVFLKMGEIYGIKVPANAILNGDGNFVYVVYGNKITKEPVKILKLSGLNAYVEGLKHNSLLVIEGQNRVKENDKVIITK